MNHSPRRRNRGFTLIELMVVVAVVVILAVLVAPSVQDMIVMQRLRGVNAQLITDLQFARSEAVARGRVMRVNFGTNGTQTCYTLYTAIGNGITRCDCLLGAGATCTAAGSQEVRTVQVLRSTQVSFTWPVTQDSAFGYDPVTGGLISIPTDTGSSPLASVQFSTHVDNDRQLRNTVIQSGRPTTCAPNQARMQVTAC